MKRRGIVDFGNGVTGDRVAQNTSAPTGCGHCPLGVE